MHKSITGNLKKKAKGRLRSVYLRGSRSKFTNYKLVIKLMIVMTLVMFFAITRYCYILKYFFLYLKFLSFKNSHFIRILQSLKFVNL